MYLIIITSSPYIDTFHRFQISPLKRSKNVKLVNNFAVKNNTIEANINNKAKPKDR